MNSMYCNCINYMEEQYYEIWCIAKIFFVYAYYDINFFFNFNRIYILFFWQTSSWGNIQLYNSGLLICNCSFVFEEYTWKRTDYGNGNMDCLFCSCLLNEAYYKITYGNQHIKTPAFSPCINIRRYYWSKFKKIKKVL